MKIYLAALGFVLLAFSFVHPTHTKAQMFGPSAMVEGKVSGSSFQGQGDIVSGAYAYWGNRAYNAAYATGSNPWIDYSCNSGSSTGTVNILSSGYGDQATLSSTCGVSTITVTKIYDQTGNGHFVNTGGTSPGGVTVSLNCINATYPCIKINGGGLSTNSGDLTLPQAFSLTFAAERTATFTSYGTVLMLAAGGAQSGFCNAANEALQYASGPVTCSSNTVPDNSFNAVEHVYNGASSLMYTNGTANPGTTNPGSNTGSGKFYIGGLSNPCTCNFLESVLYASGLTSTQLQNLNTNIHAAYGGF